MVRGNHAITARAVRKEIRDGTMQPTIDALNALQAVPWTINKRVLDAARQCNLHRIDVEGIPPDDSSKRVTFEIDMRTAEAMAAHERFWIAMNLDWRGRVYGVPHFNFQRDDRVRALFLFADGEPIGTEGLKWLKVHTANCGDFDKISKSPFDERERWVDASIEKIKGSAKAPLEQRWWTEADKPFQFLAACFELSTALEQGPTFVSRLPISFDGSCSGLQHLSAIMRDEKTAKLVNLTAQRVPQDIYEDVAKRVKECVERNVDVYEDGHLARLWLNYGIDRKVVKRNVMTYFYGSEEFGMAGQQRDDLMEALADKVERGKMEKHPFEGESDAAAKYLAKQVYLTIKNGIKRPAAAMEFLHKISTAMSEAGLYPQWTTPAGFRWANRYCKHKTDQIRLYLNSLGMSFRVLLATGEEPKIDKERAMRGIAPNFIQACDAAHLMLTVNAAVSEGITSIATVHDCFGCLPSRAERFRKIIREQFVRMYEENDVLAQVLEQARKDLNEPNTKRMPSAPPSRGSLDIKNVLDAEFAFA
jgi:DNA-directed RNA polymerase